MKIKEIIKETQKPAIYTKGTASMWEDEYISKFLLEAHINPDMDLASRNKVAIEKTVEWMFTTVNGKNMNILDLGCGPGLYCELMAQRGHKITGMDFSKRSINYATTQAKKKKLDINYQHANYLSLDYENQFDLIIMIYCDFGALIPEERDIVIKNIYRALKPGGFFIFDSLNLNSTESFCKNREWEMKQEGFWKNSPYIVFSEPFKYDEGRIFLDQHTVIDENGDFKIYRFWNQCFDGPEMLTELSKYGFVNNSYYKDILKSDNALWSRETNFYKAGKKK